MSNMSRAFIMALKLGLAMASGGIEWRGIFATPGTTYQWKAQKVGGAYADATMKIVALPVTAADTTTLTASVTKGTTAFATDCEDLTQGQTIKPAEGKCFKLMFDSTACETNFVVDASTAANVAFFTEHGPTEFEHDAHYFKDDSGVDIEPGAQDPVPGGGHSHGTWNDDFEGKCVCQARAHNWKLDCLTMAPIEAAVSYLQTHTTCKPYATKDAIPTGCVAKTTPPQQCQDNYYLMQAHHDHCLHDQLPTNIEQALHDFEHNYDDCFIKRQYNAALSACPAVTCTDQTPLNNAIVALGNGCNTKTLCDSTATCKDAIKKVLMYHDICPEDSLPDTIERALHDYEEPCEDQLCNSAPAAFDPYADVSDSSEYCVGKISSRAVGSQDSLFFAALALPLAVLMSS
jgi:hypothetical protein